MALVGMVLTGPQAAYAQTPAGTGIVNTGTVEYYTPAGRYAGGARDEARVMVGHRPAVDVEQQHVVHTAGGEWLWLPHTVRNLGNDADRFTVTGACPAGWYARVRVDENGNGELDGSDPVLGDDDLGLGMGESADVFLDVQPPAGLETGSVNRCSIEAVSAADAGVRASTVDEIRGPPLEVRLTKTVSADVAAAGDTLTYSLTAEVLGVGTADVVRVTDVLPEPLQFVAGSVLVDGREHDARVDGRLLEVDLGARDTGERVEIQFRAQVPMDAAAGGEVENVGRVSWEAEVGGGEAASSPVLTRIDVPELAISKSVAGPSPAAPGDTLRYRIVVRNLSSALTARGAVLTDTVPDLLGHPDSGSGDVLEWTLGSIAPGDSVARVLYTTVSERATDGDEVVNRAWVRLGAREWSAESEGRMLVSGEAPSMRVELEAGKLEAAIGSSIPFTMRGVNDGPVGLRDVHLRVDLPLGTRRGDAPIVAYTNVVPVEQALDGQLSTSRASGGAWRAVEPDSVIINGRTVTVYFPVRIERGQGVAFTYDMTVVNPEARQLETIGQGFARRGLDFAMGEIYSTALAHAWTRLSAGRPVETRISLGKVFFDRNANGEQDAGEYGIEGVEIWTEDGEVSRTDAAGKYSFDNLRPGRHVLRVDPSTLPVWARVAGGDARSVSADGWTSPRVSFPVTSRVGRPHEVVLTDGAAVPEAVVCMYTIECIASGPDGTAEDLPDSLVIRMGPRPGDQGSWVWRVPAGWSIVSLEAVDSSAADDARIIPDASGGIWLEWDDTNAGEQRIELARAGAAGEEPVRVASARSNEERQAGASSLTAGPAPTFFAPADGSVHRSDRVFVGVRGEGLRNVRLVEGGEVIAQAQLRPDGVHDFIALPMSPGPHQLALSMENSWGQVRWDSLNLHVGGPARAIEAEPVRAQSGRDVHVRVRLLDEWGVPVVRTPTISVFVEGARVRTPDASRADVGHQIQADSAGWLDFVLEAGAENGEFRILLKGSEFEAELPLLVVPDLAPLRVTAVGEAGLGSAPESFAAMSAQGRVGERTALTLSVDSRRLDAGRDEFGRDIDPMDEGQYPVLGDASSRRSPGASRYSVAGRLERGLDYVAFGDLEQDDFAEGLELSAYRRALPGLSARYGVGPLVLRAFGSLTDQALNERQFRGDGTSGPFDLGSGFIPATEQVVLQVRDANNAARILAERTLARYVDYQIDPVRGQLLLKRPVPGFDVTGNPLFVVVRYETRGAGDERPVWGVRVTGVTGDSTLRAPLGAQYIRDDQPGHEFELAGVSAGIEMADALVLNAEAAHATRGDSAGVAALVEGIARLWGGGLVMDGRWMRVGDEFENPAQPALEAGVEQLEAGAAVTLGGTTLTGRYEHQEFRTMDLERTRVLAGVEQQLGGEVRARLTSGHDAVRQDSLAESGYFTEGRVEWRPSDRVTLWGEGRRQHSDGGAQLMSGHFAGGGASVEVLPGVRVEGRHLQVSPDSGDSYGLSTAGVRSALPTGTEAWARYQLEGGVDGERGAALVGLSQHLALGDDWTVLGMFERRDGLERAPLTSPLRAAPFAGVEEDYWAASLGAEYLPTDRPYQLTGHGEWRQGEFESQQRVLVAGDMTISGDLSLLARQEYLSRERRDLLGEGGAPASATLQHSTLGLAYRPVGHDRLNVLVKADWKNEEGSASAAPVLGGRSGDQERLILAAEAIWTPVGGTEIGARLGRRFVSEAVHSSLIGRDIEHVTDADFAAARLRASLAGPVSLEGETQLLRGGGSNDLIWSAAPAVVLGLGALDIRAGYRWGPLVDPDFVRHQGEGWFVTFTASVTEGTIESAADFWRDRLDGR